ncbi:MAG: acylphosphatase [Alphaproteobacteria bacterium]|nr:acylphosphatase [Alphaproteobacteria bacterium]
MSAGADRKSVRLRVTGQVQGVGYRAWAVAAATGQKVQGFVRNRADGSVEILAVGLPAAVDAFVALCRRGPLMAKVADVKVEPAEGIVGPGFKQLPTV